MKLKYYLRGLGIGIICTAIIMGIALSGNKKETMTDTEIIERARLMGMVMPEDVENDSLEEEKESADDKDSEPETENKSAKSKTDNQENDKKEDSQVKTDKAEDSKKGDNKTQKEETAQKPSTQEIVEIEIKAGDYSATVSQTLKRAGLITDADAFNRYLTQKGVDQNLRIGVYQIPKGATQDEIIEILQK